MIKKRIDVRKYYRIWIQLTRLAIGTYFSNAVDYTSYFIGKLVRFDLRDLERYVDSLDTESNGV